jgi:iron(III) transport system substrate-binding protein
MHPKQGAATKEEIEMKTLSHVLRTCVAACAMLAAAPALSQSPTTYEGADRSERLIEGARKEGTVTLYTSMNARDAQRIVAAFEERHGIKVNVWRSGQHKVLERTITEARAGRNDVDVVHNPAPPMEVLHREGLLQPAKSPHHADLTADALPSHGEWAGMRTYVFVSAYNTDKVKKEELPTSYQNLLDPNWKGRLGVEGKGQEWFYALIHAMGPEEGVKLFREIARTNGLSVRMGNSLLTNMVASGEVPFAINLYSYLVEQAKAKGAPIEYMTLAPTIAFTDGVGIAKNAPHPHAATLLYDFMLSEGQKMAAEQHHFTTHRRDQPKIAAFQPVYLDPTNMMKDYDKWLNLFKDTIEGR